MAVEPCSVRATVQQGPVSRACREVDGVKIKTLLSNRIGCKSLLWVGQGHKCWLRDGELATG